MGETDREVELIRASVPDAVLEVREQPQRGMFWLNISPPAIVEAATILRDHPALDYKMLCDLFGVDYPARDRRFDVVYNLVSVSRNRRLFLRVRVGENESVPTLCGVYPNANWCEREVFDLFGVPFADHPDPRRILMPDDWQGFPQRKDYPLEGPGELLMENPQDWLKLRQAKEEAELE